jgi:hypothetical protein
MLTPDADDALESSGSGGGPQAIKVHRNIPFMDPCRDG